MIYRFGECTYDSERHELWRGQHQIAVERQVREVLLYFLQQRQRVLSRDELLEACWRETYVSDAALSSCLSRLRQALGQRRGGPVFIQTVHGAGYRFVAEVVEDTPAASAATTEAAEALLATTEAVSHEPAPGVSVWPAAGTERRQLTVLSCALAPLEVLLAHLDEETLHDLVQQFRRLMLDTMAHFGGYVAHYGMASAVVYYGYPQAHEDDAQRAIRSGLALVEQVGELEASPEVMRLDVRLSVRVGIHTGGVIVEASPLGLSATPVVGGAAPSVALRVQEMARPHMVVISAATARLVQGHFVCKALAEALTVEAGASLALYEVEGVQSYEGDARLASVPRLTPFVGREAEMALVQERWEQACEGQGQVVLVRGEAGIGKSRLVQELKARALSRPHLRVECRCSPYHQNTAFYPLVEALRRALRGEAETSGTENVAALEGVLRRFRAPVGELVPLLAELLGLEVPLEGYAPLPVTPQGRRQGLLDGLLHLLLGQVQAEPLLVIVEDVHWADASTLEFLDLLIEQVSSASLLVVLTCRPVFELPWSFRSGMTPIVLNRLTREQVEAMVGHLARRHPVSASALGEIVDKSDGVPLFVEELTQMVVEAETFDAAKDDPARGSAPLSIPSTLQDLLMARLDRLGAAKEVAHWGAVLGREFHYEVLSAVAPCEEATLQEALGHLVRAELLFPRGIPPQTRQYRFKHALLQEAAYDSLLKRRRQVMHRQVAEVLEAHFPELVATQPEVLAHHYTAAGLAEQAIPYWQQAAERAIQRSANREALRYLTTALEMFQTLPDNAERQLRELALQMLLGPVVMATQGYAAPEVQQVYARAHHLCQQLGDIPQLFPALWGLWRFYLNRARLAEAGEVSEHLFTLAQRLQDAGLRMQAHIALGVTRTDLGDFAMARDHFDSALTLYDASQHRALSRMYGGLNPRVHCLAFVAHVLWRLGFPEQALARSREALALARQLAHPNTLAYALHSAGVVHAQRREAEQVQVLMDEQTALATEHGFALLRAASTIMRGWALSEQGQVEAGVAQLRAGLAAHIATGAELTMPYWYRLLAEAHRTQGDVREGLAVLAEVLARIERTGERHVEAEAHRLKGELLLLQAGPEVPQAAACFHGALDIARRQQAKSLELRAAMSLARLWQQQDKRRAAYDLLAPVYGWFTEGFDTADLQDARVLLMQLA